VTVYIDIIVDHRFFLFALSIHSVI